MTIVGWAKWVVMIGTILLCLSGKCYTLVGSPCAEKRVGRYPGVTHLLFCRHVCRTWRAKSGAFPVTLVIRPIDLGLHNTVYNRVVRTVGSAGHLWGLALHCRPILLYKSGWASQSMLAVSAQLPLKVLPSDTASIEQTAPPWPRLTQQCCRWTRAFVVPSTCPLCLFDSTYCWPALQLLQPG